MGVEFPVIDVRALNALGRPVSDTQDLERTVAFVELCQWTAAEMGIAIRDLDRALCMLGGSDAGGCRARRIPACHDTRTAVTRHRLSSR